MHVLYKIFPERNEEQYAEDSSEERTEEDLVEVHHDVRVCALKDEQRRQSEDGSGHNHSRAGTYRLDYHILAQCVLFLQRVAEADGYDRDRNRRLENLAHFQTEVGGRRAENYGHQKPHPH